MLPSWKEVPVVPVPRKGCCVEGGNKCAYFAKASWDIGRYLQAKLESPLLYEGPAVAWAGL